MIVPPNEKGPGAAATATRTGTVASSKTTRSDIANPDNQQPRFTASLLVFTGGKQAHRVTTRPSLRAAIDAKCKSCIYDPFGGRGTWREQVQACPSANCPLHPVRPMSIKAQNSAVETRARASGVFGSAKASEPLHGAGLAADGQTIDERRGA